MVTEYILKNVVEDQDVKKWYSARLKSVFKEATVVERIASQYTRLAAWIAFIISTGRNKILDLGFSDVGSFHLFCCEMIKAENLHNFNVENLQTFSRKIKPFRKWPNNRNVALESLISKKFGVVNNFKAEQWHRETIVSLAHSETSLSAITKELNRRRYWKVRMQLADQL
jgi:hypothetical protein